jgi:hypothetical protein
VDVLHRDGQPFQRRATLLKAAPSGEACGARYAPPKMACRVIARIYLVKRNNEAPIRGRGRPWRPRGRRPPPAARVRCPRRHFLPLVGGDRGKRGGSVRKRVHKMAYFHVLLVKPINFVDLPPRGGCGGLGGGAWRSVCPRGIPATTFCNWLGAIAACAAAWCLQK